MIYSDRVGRQFESLETFGSFENEATIQIVFCSRSHLEESRLFSKADDDLILSKLSHQLFWLHDASGLTWGFTPPISPRIVISSFENSSFDNAGLVRLLSNGPISSILVWLIPNVYSIKGYFLNKIKFNKLQFKSFYHFY